MKPKLALSQKIALFLLYGLIILMVIYSIKATENLGQSGFNNCVQKKCDSKGDAYCNKFREIDNCCLGAGGKLGSANGKYICLFT